MKFKKYRIVRKEWKSCYLGGILYYQAQIWRLWYPFWTPIYLWNGEESIVKARELIKKHRNPEPPKPKTIVEVIEC